MYQEFYELIQQYIFGNPETMTAHMDLVATACATIGVVFLMSLPFIIVYKFIQMIT